MKEVLEVNNDFGSPGHGANIKFRTVKNMRPSKPMACSGGAAL
jgi:hypothetical protein